MTKTSVIIPPIITEPHQAKYSSAGFSTASNNHRSLEGCRTRRRFLSRMRSRSAAELPSRARAAKYQHLSPQPGPPRVRMIPGRHSSHSAQEQRKATLGTRPGIRPATQPGRTVMQQTDAPRLKLPYFRHSGEIRNPERSGAGQDSSSQRTLVSRVPGNDAIVRFPTR